jgi:hypothetical protein
MPQEFIPTSAHLSLAFHLDAQVVLDEYEVRARGKKEQQAKKGLLELQTVQNFSPLLAPSCVNQVC